MEKEIKISTEVLEAIVIQIISEIKGVRLLGALNGNISYFFQKKIPERSVQISLKDKEVLIKVNLSIQYGEKILDKAREVQEAVKKTVESTSDIKVKSIDVNVKKIYFE